jgi:prepilin-type N-terminal cleavage/methylation domain-containing protein
MKRSSNMSDSRGFTPRHGFTLVELLVVIVIIGMLAGLLLPALVSARGRARIAQCTNNQKELGLAILQYETAKQHLPGYANTVNSTRVSWIPVLFPYLGRMDLWTGSGAISGWRRGGNASVAVGGTATGGVASTSLIVGQLLCPDDIQIGTITPLSYVVNVGSSGANPSTQDGVFRDLDAFPLKFLSTSSIPATSRRPMISELSYTINNCQWNEFSTHGDTTKVTGARFGFQFAWASDPGAAELFSTLFSNMAATPPQPLIHRGIVITTFCDGHVESVAEDAACDTFDWQQITP